MSKLTTPTRDVIIAAPPGCCWPGSPPRCSNDYAEVQHPMFCSCGEFDR